MTETAQQPFLDYYTYPPVGADDWRYTYQTAVVRTLEMQMLTRAALLDLANAADFNQAVEMLAPTEYALGSGSRNLAAVEKMLTEKRGQLREFFDELMLDKAVVELFKTRDDFANLRLAVRRVVTDKPVGTDYSGEGNVGAELFEPVFAEEAYELFPDYMQQAAEQAILAYYQKKEIPRIDYAIDAFQAEYNLQQGRKLKSIFLTNLFRIQIDLTNIRTMFRLKFTASELRNVFLEGGFIQFERLFSSLESDYEAMAQPFFILPHHRIIETGASYLSSNKSFLVLEQQCEQYLAGYLHEAIVISAGPQPVVAYLLNKEDEIRKLRLILTAKRNMLDTKLIVDRVG